MRLFVQNENCPSQVLFAFDEVARQNVDSVRWAVAYATLRGCERLVTRIGQRMGADQWAAARKRFVVSLDYGLTEPAALTYLGALPNSMLRIAGADVLERETFIPVRAYHPKIFLFDAGEATRYVVGSANLTESALITNVEVVATGPEEPSNTNWNDAWRTLVHGTVRLEDAHLTAYTQRWRRPAPRPVEPEPTPPAREVASEGKPIFVEAIQRGEVAPAELRHFWIEAGSMTSGGAQNQLELPRGANTFFGFDFSSYEEDHEVIGVPVLRIGRQSWNDRRLTWHGNNRMERINLPTVAQGGFNYANTAILFRRRTAGFEIKVAPWDDREALAWRSASDRLNRVFRLGQRGERICGLF